jgi:hypothetical protein
LVLPVIGPRGERSAFTYQGLYINYCKFSGQSLHRRIEK